MKVLISIIVILGIPLFYGLQMFPGKAKNLGSGPAFIFWIFVQIALSLLLHFVLYTHGYIYWFSVPLGWALCIPAVYYYAYHITRPGFFGRGFTFSVMLFFIVIPVLVSSGIFAVILTFVLKK